MNPVRRALFVLASMVLFMMGASTRALSQDSKSVHGQVRTRNGQSLQGAQLQILPSGPSAESDSDGTFIIGPISAGTYQVRVRRLGFRSDTETLKVPGLAGNWVIVLDEAPEVLDPVFSSALEQDLPRVMERMRTHMGATVFGPELMKQYPGLSVDEILAADSAVFPFLREASLPRCYPRVYLNGKRQVSHVVIEYGPHQHTIIPDRDIRSYVSMKDIAVIEVYRFERRQVVSEPWFDPRDGVNCWPTILIWTKDFKQKPYKGN